MGDCMLRRQSMSAIVPAFNRADLVAATVDSLLGQVEPFSQIIVVDDGSTDGTAQALEPYGDRIHVARTLNHGVQHARNHGARLATSDWITFCDSDDLLDPDFTTVMNGFLRKHGDFDLLYCNFVPFRDSLDDLDKFTLAPPGFFSGAEEIDGFRCDVPDLYSRILSYQPLFMTGMTVRRSHYLDIGGFDTRLRGVKAEDWEFTLRAVALSRTALCLRPLARVRKHHSNDSADSLLMKLGEVAILEHALQHHTAAKAYGPAILRSIETRRTDAFNAAFGRGDLLLAQELLGKIALVARDPKSRLKRAIVKLPAPAARALWRLTQL